jgi:DNA-binding transcriptional LysR family regulator
MELRHLRYFAAVAEDLSFRRAARRLFVFEPALSQQIGDLEDELGLKLFDRNSRKVQLTEIGLVFLAGAKRTLASAEEAVARAKEAAAGARGRLSIGTIGPVTQAFLPDALARFRELYPLVEVSVLHMDNRTQHDALLNGSIMLGIGYPSQNPDEAEALSATLLLRSPVCIVCSSHRWPAKRGRPALSDFRNDNFLAFMETGGDYMRLVRDICQRDAGFEPTFLQIGNTFESMLGMVAAGRGVFLTPEITLRDRAIGANHHLLKGSKGQVELFLLRRKEPEPVATLTNFVKVLVESVERCAQRGDKSSSVPLSP